LPAYSILLVCLQNSPTNERPAKGHLVCILQIAAGGKPARWPGNCDAQRRQQAMQISRRGFSREVEIRRDDDLLWSISLDSIDELANLELVRPYAFYRRNCAV